jgi:hypothetical protein
MFLRSIGLMMILVSISAVRAAAQGPATGGAAAGGGDWYSKLMERAPKFGHRNWICVVDSAYPSQTSPGIETLVTGGDQLDVLKQVIAALATQRHVRPVYYLDAELDYVPEAESAGADKYRADLAQTLAGADVKKVLHADIIDKLDAAGAKFHVLMLKTTLAVPYTSVFIELDCGYWSPESEQRMRAAMAKPAQ